MFKQCSRLAHSPGWHCRIEEFGRGKMVWHRATRNHSGVFYRSLLGARPPRCSLSDSHLPWVTCLLPEPQVSEREQDPAPWPLKRAPGLLTDSLLLWAGRVPGIFTARRHVGSSPRLRRSGWGPPSRVRRRPPQGTAAAPCPSPRSSQPHPPRASAPPPASASGEWVLLLGGPPAGCSGRLLYNSAINQVWHHRR